MPGGQTGICCNRIMKRIKLLLTALLWWCSGTCLYAQDYLDEARSGYAGGFIPELKQVKKAVSFLVMGDWGRNGDYHQKAVATQMSKAAATIDAKFIVAVGDNFYPSGVQSTQDPQWKYSFEDVYSSYPLNREWYVALGNHDYKGNVQAQIDYSAISRRWVMPAPYYSRKIQLEDGGEILLVVMDSNPYIDSYYAKDGAFSASLRRQDTAAQTKWLSQVLSDSSAAIKWKIVAGHHPLYSGGKRKASDDTRLFEQKFRAFFDRYKVDAYLCGHEHDLQIIRPEGAYTTQFLSGAACEVRPTGTRAGTLFAASAPGFMTFSIVSDTLLVQVVNGDGSILYTTSLTR